MRTTRRMLVGVLALSVYALSTATGLGAQACEWGWVEDDAATIGIGRLLCLGGECEINLVESDGQRAHRFTTEPRVMELSAPASSELREGDVIVAVDGVPITTLEGGRRLARAEVGVPIELTVRGSTGLRVVRLVPVPGCPIGSLSVRRAGTTTD